MRLASCLFAFAVVLSPLALSPAPAAAQQPTTPLACDGTYNIVRVSEIKPGMMQKFLQAAAAQQAWYKQAGTPDQITVMRIIDRNPDTKVATYSDTQALTSHTRPGDSSQPPAHDAGYDAFVALYKESSTIKSEYFTCMAR
ncbi:hypothetical protein JAO29_13685 [Edaphobacter sp. HDX4]|uniref:hypothetical protein n=1 Tax=Edaphobacter sp. HDX4 TaxID=2794064 RepID=UPI002FE697AC